MRQYLIMCRSLTNAQRCERLLRQEGIAAHTVKAPQALRSGGCGYAVSLHRDFDKALRLLSEAGLLKGRLYFREGDGEYREVLP